MPKSKALDTKQRATLFAALKARFEQHSHRHTGVAWSAVQTRLESHTEKLWTLAAMEESGGEPDVIFVDKKSGELHFVDCAAQSPKGRRSVCYDRQALDSRKENKPKSSALEMAAAMGAEILTETQYRALQSLEAFDTTTSSWVHTPAEIRKLGGAVFCDRRYDTVFLYHNGAESYYAARGFRCLVKI